jgi:hypothetical protein
MSEVKSMAKRSKKIGRPLKSRIIPIEKVINISDPDILWYYIPGYNGYEISNYGIIRSMKHFMKYPYGMWIRPIKNTRGLYQLSNDHNERVLVPLEELWRLSQEYDHGVTGYPRHTLQTDRSSRNHRCFIPPKPRPAELDEVITPTFTIIDEDRSNAIVPLIGIDGNNTYYGTNKP